MVSFEKDIKPLFTDMDINCMLGWGVELDSYAWLSDPAGNATYPDHARARKVYSYLEPEGSKPRMPQGGEFWNDDMLALYRQWMDEGFAP